MIAARRADVADLNEKARALLRAEGLIDELELTIGGRSFAPGDQVMTLRNDRRLGVINGTRGIVEAVDVDDLSVHVRLGDERLVSLPSDYLEAGNVTHANAITGHKAQGMTTDRAFVLGDESLYREWGYVAMSRGREENRLYVVMGDGARDEVGGAVDRPYEVEQFMRSLERSRAKSMAFDANGDVTERDTQFLRQERDEIYERLSGGPRDQAGELDRTRHEAKRMRGALERERRLLAEAKDKRNGMGTLAKARRKAEVEELRRRITGCQRAERRLMENLTSLGNREDDLIQEQREREQWLQEQNPALMRLQAIEDELNRRNRALLRDRENTLPRYLENSLGHAPERPSEKREWGHAVIAIENYREKYGITDETRALGKEPRDRDQRWERDQVERMVEGTNERRLGRSRENDFGRELSLEP